jgi:hypothetical protein
MAKKFRFIGIGTVIVSFALLRILPGAGPAHAAEEIKKVKAEKSVLTEVVQVGVVVKDLQKAMEQYWEILGIGPWRVLNFEPPNLSNTMFRGKPTPYSMKLGIARVGSVDLELIQPIAGPSTYHEFMEKRGEGIHHVAVIPALDYDSTVDLLGKRGIGILMSGVWGGAGGYSYMDTEKDLKAIFEIYKPRPANVKAPGPSSWYPSADAKKPEVEVVFSSITQIGIVVKDLNKAMKKYWDLFGIGPWRVHTYAPHTGLTNMNIRGKEEPYGMRLALAYTGKMNWELIQPLSGPNIYKEFLEQKGEGLHHVNTSRVADFDQTMLNLGKKGIKPLMTGTFMQGTYAYMDTEKELGGVIFEMSTGRPPGVRSPVEAYYPK